MNLVERSKSARKITIIGLLTNLFLIVLKFFGGLFGRSSALIADSIHSISDLISDFFLLWGIKITHEPPDKCHKYGHGKYETILTLGISLLLILISIGLFAGGVKKAVDVLLVNKSVRPNFLALIIALISVFLKEILFRLTVKEGKRIDSGLLVANAWHHRSDAVSSVASFLGIFGAIILGNKGVILDPLAAAVVSIFILITGIRMFRESFDELTEKSLRVEDVKSIMTIIQNVRGVYNPHNLKTRRVGINYVIDVHIEVQRGITIESSHDIATRVEKNIREKFNTNSIINVHTEPLGSRF